jgi:hypothetical protein
MTQIIRHPASFAGLMVIVFLGLHLFLYGTVSTGPHLYLYLGWLELHRYGNSWSIEHLHFLGLVALLSGSGLLAWFVRRSVREHDVA